MPHLPNPRSAFGPAAAVLVAAVLCVALGRPGSAAATTARLAALGGGDFIEDDHNVERWYGSLGDYPDRIVLEAGHFTLPGGWHDGAGHLVSGPGLGATLGPRTLGKVGTLGFRIDGSGDDLDPGSMARDRMGTTWSAMWSRRFGAWQPALMCRRGTDTGEESLAPGDPASPLRTRDRSRTEYGAGLRWDISTGVYLDVAGEARRHSEQTTVADTVITAAGPTETSGGSLGLRTRAFIRLGEFSALVPLIEYLNEDRPLASPSPALGRSLDGRLFRTGAGLNWFPDPDHLFIVGLDYLDATADYLTAVDGGTPVLDIARRWRSLSLTMGFEVRFRYWLTLRGSCRYEPVAFGTADTEAADDFSTFMVNLGGAVQLGEYDLDIALTDQEPRSVAGYWGHSLLDDSATWLTVTLRRTF